MIKQNNYPYPTSAYICCFTYKYNGKVEGMIPNPEIVNTLEAIKVTVNNFNSSMRKKGRPELINDSVLITRLDLIDLFSYSDKKWNNPNCLIKKVDVMASCFKLYENDYNEYRVLIAPCKDNRGGVWNTIQSVFRSSSNKLNWKTLLHSDNPIADKTKHIALYRCGAPEVYYPNKNIIMTLPPIGSKENPKMKKV